jgi:hypothetical protein
MSALMGRYLTQKNLFFDGVVKNPNDRINHREHRGHRGHGEKLFSLFFSKISVISVVNMFLKNP